MQDLNLRSGVRESIWSPEELCLWGTQDGLSKRLFRRKSLKRLGGDKG